MKLKWFHCSHEHYDGIRKFDVFILGDSTEHLFFSVEFAKPFGSTNFFPCKCQYGSEFSQIGTPHFSLEGVLYVQLILFCLLTETAHMQMFLGCCSGTYLSERPG